jgi:hypothetical protein
MSPEPLPPLSLPPGWNAVPDDANRAGSLLRVFKSGPYACEALIGRCATGRLRSAYPVGSRDVEVRIVAAEAADVIAETLATLRAAIHIADPGCRRVIFAAPAGDTQTMTAAENAGFHFVVDVDLPAVELSLFVSEPEWVASIEPGLDHMPQT